jgi:quercetin dioxygenase-like cupin family protein
LNRVPEKQAADWPANQQRIGEAAMAVETKPSQASPPGGKITVAGPGEYFFGMTKLNEVRGGPDYSSALGTAVEGERMLVALMRMAAGTGSDPHSHPNEQWIYVLEGTFSAKVGGTKVDVPAGSVLYIPSNTVHEGKATPDGDVLFFTVKDASHSLHGIKAA